MILLVGGTGTLGRAIVRRLNSAGTPMTVMSRNPDAHADRFPSGAEFVYGDLGDKSSLENAVKGKSVVVHAAHSMLGRGRNASCYIDDLGGRQLIDASVTAGVKRFIFVSAWFPPGFAQIPFVKAKRRVAAHLQSSGLPYVIFQPTAFMDMHAEQLIGRRVEANKKVIVFGRGTTTRNLVAADDVAELIVGALQSKQAESTTVNVGGPQNLSTKDIIAVYESLHEKTARIVHVPLAVASMAYWLLRPLHPGVSQIMDITRQIERDGDGFELNENPVCRANESLEHWALRQHRASNSFAD